MDNRLREIEQWVAEARDDLGESGQEAYVRKLYLLDAEIRAAIKDSGILPQNDSPRSAAVRVRREWMPVSALGVLAFVLAATTVYLRVNGVPDFNSAPTILTAPSESAVTLAQAEQSSPAPRNLTEYFAGAGEEIMFGTHTLASTAQPVASPQIEPVDRTPSRPVASEQPVQSSSASRISQPIMLASTNRPAEAARSEPVVDRGAANSVIMHASYQSGAATPTVSEPLTTSEPVRPAVKPATTFGANRAQKGGAAGAADPEEKAESGSAEERPRELALNTAELEKVLAQPFER